MEGVALRRTSLDSPEVQLLLAEWNAELIAAVPGFVPGGGSMVRRDEFLSRDGMLLVAMVRRLAVGCGGVRQLDRATAEIKRLFVKPNVRGRGIGHALLSCLEQHACEVGYETPRLDTTGSEPRALSLFHRCGYVEIPDYNGNPYARHWFEKHLGVR
jgi:GNAT superfamily N-acetyltransferase